MTEGAFFDASIAFRRQDDEVDGFAGSGMKTRKVTTDWVVVLCPLTREAIFDGTCRVVYGLQRLPPGSALRTPAFVTTVQ
ncbi:MAG TPA: hypothetical protein VM580_12485 [Labilithrix sp.]|nr:hypothetical protein [Labilithrix sp.]